MKAKRVVFLCALGAAVVVLLFLFLPRPVSLLRLGLWWGMSLFTIGCFALYIPVFVRQWQSQNDSEPLGQG